MNSDFEQNINGGLCNKLSWECLGEKLSPGNISVLNINMRSILAKFSCLAAYLGQLRYGPTFVVVTETWLTAVSDVGMELPGYKSLSLYRSYSSGGGIKIYYRGDLNAETVFQLHRYSVREFWWV